MFVKAFVVVNVADNLSAITLKEITLWVKCKCDIKCVFATATPIAGKNRKKVKLKFSVIFLQTTTTTTTTKTATTSTTTTTKRVRTSRPNYVAMTGRGRRNPGIRLEIF